MQKFCWVFFLRFGFCGSYCCQYICYCCFLCFIVVGLTRAKIDNYCLHSINISRQGCLCAVECVCAEAFTLAGSHAALHSCTLCVRCLVSFVNKIIVFVAKKKKKKTAAAAAATACLFLLFSECIDCPYGFYLLPSNASKDLDRNNEKFATPFELY